MSNRDPLLIEIAQLRERIEHLEGKNKQYLDLLAPRGRRRLPDYWGLTRQQENFIMCLYETKSGHLSAERIHFVVSDTEPDPRYRLVTALVSATRRKLKSFGIRIVTVYGEGYRLDTASHPIIAKAMKEAEEAMQ
jgi:hypothetical protein